MKKKLILATALSTVAAVGVANIASAASISVTTPTTVKICKTITNAYDAQTATFNYTFTTTDSGISGLPTGQSIAFSNAAYDSNHEVSKCIDVDITGITAATESPAQYNITVAETPVSGYSTDSTTYNLLVDVRNTTGTGGAITGQVASAYLQNAGKTAKVTQFDFSSARQYNENDITISKTVKGTAGDINKLFKLTVNVSGTAGDTYTVTGAGSGSAASCAANTDCVIYLKHGDTARIGYNGTASQVPVGATYTVTEDAYSDYTTKVSIGGAAETTARTSGSQTISPSSSDNIVAFSNEKNSSTPTGIFLNVWPYILLGAISLGAVIYAKKAYASRTDA